MAFIGEPKKAMKHTHLKPGKPLERKTPLKRYGWIKSKPTPWRRSAKYKRAKAEAFKPFTREDGWVMCVFCGRYFPPNGIDASHIKSVDAWAHLKMESLNIMSNCPGFRGCHTWYENLTEAEQMAEVEKKFPGREEELLALARGKSLVGR